MKSLQFLSQTFLLGCFVIAGSAGLGRAGTVSDGGSALAVGTAAYNYDAAGYLFFATEPPLGPSEPAFSTLPTQNSVNLPSYVSSVTTPAGAAITTLAAGFSYSNIQVTSASTAVESGLAFGAARPGQGDVGLLNINFAYPAIVHLGVLVNNEPNAHTYDQFPATLTLQAPTVGDKVTETIAAPTTPGQDDLYFFNFFAPAGSTFELLGQAQTNQFNQIAIGGLTFVTITPEPSSWFLATVGAATLLAYGRTKARRRSA